MSDLKVGDFIEIDDQNLDWVVKDKLGIYLCSLKNHPKFKITTIFSDEPIDLGEQLSDLTEGYQWNSRLIKKLETE